MLGSRGFLPISLCVVVAENKCTKSINFMNIHGIYNCAHPRLNNTKNMTTVIEKACERGDRMMRMNDGGDDDDDDDDDDDTMMMMMMMTE